MFTLSNGQTFAHEVVLTKERIGSFGHATGDEQPIHFDPSFAQRCGFEDVIGHGVLSIGFVSSLLGMYMVPEEMRNDWVIVLGEIGRLRFCNPTHPGNQIRITAKVSEVKSNGWCVLTVQIHNVTTDKPVIEETTVTILPKQIT
jgi:3-hydroxybutyryl-CoA dehydratase